MNLPPSANTVKEYWLPITVSAIFLLALAAYIANGAFEKAPLTTLEAMLFQIVILVIGILASYTITKKVTFDAAVESNRRHTKPALRRSMSLYHGLFDLSGQIQLLRIELGEDWRLEMIQALVDTHIRTGADSIEDWRDILPAEVLELEESNRAGQQ